MLKYSVKSNIITVECAGLNETDYQIASVLNRFLLYISKDKNVFFHGYRLWNKEKTRIIEPSVIIEEAKDLVEPFHTYLHLKEANVKSNFFCDVCEATIYYFENSVRWTDFLASSKNVEPQKLIEKGILSAYFTVGDYGADLWFGCSRVYEKQVLQLIEDMANLGYEIKRIKTPKVTKRNLKKIFINQRESQAYGLQEIHVEQFLDILKATECTDFVLEVADMRYKDNLVNTVFRVSLNDEAEQTIDKIIKARPDMISVYINYQTVKEHSFLPSDGDIILEFIPDENVLILNCNHQKFGKLNKQIMKILLMED